jgi:hypothetical protein
LPDGQDSQVFLLESSSLILLDKQVRQLAVVQVDALEI